MIQNQWYAIMQSKEVGKKPVGVTRMNEKLVLWRDSAGNLSCVYDICCHRGASLALGCVKEDQIECPFHGFLYDSTGKVTRIPANGKSAQVAERYHVHAYPVQEAHGFIWLWYEADAGVDGATSGSAVASDSLERNVRQNQGQQAKAVHTLPPIPFFEELARADFKHNTFSEVWDVHYTRAIENQLDVVHVPFVHSNTIGKGDKTVVNGPVVRWEQNRMTFYVNNVHDDGTNTALPANKIPNPEKLFSLQYQAPNIWQNRISDKVRVFAAFAPIDETHTKIYLRFYQRFLPVAGLGTFVALLGNIFNKKVLHQDRRVVLTQEPKKSELHMQEKLIPGDAPIIEFRKKRAELKSAVKAPAELQDATQPGTQPTTPPPPPSQQKQE